jgi:integrase/recombinase XerD
LTENILAEEKREKYLFRIKLKPLVFNNTDHIVLDFPYNYELKEIVKKIEGVRWSQTLGSWTIKEDDFNLNRVFQHLKHYAYLDYSELKKKSHKEETKKYKKPSGTASLASQKAIDDFEKYLKAKRYRENTVNNYIPMLRFFFSGFPKTNPESITNEDIINFCNEYIVNNGYSTNYHRVFTSAIKLFYSTLIKRKVDIEAISTPRKESKMIKYLSREEMSQLIKSCQNNKHRLIILLLFACGLRKSEIPKIQLTDIRRDQKLIQIRDAKGGKDRIVPLPSKVLFLMEKYYKEYKPGKYLFEGVNGGVYSAESVYQVVKKAGKRAGLKRPVSPHMLRHTYGTQQTEQGVNTLTLQKIMGHKSSKTTEIYSHISQKQIGNTSSPIDNLDIEL